LFAGLREQAGASTLLRSVHQGTTVAELYAAMFPVGPSGRMPVLFAVEQAYVPGHTVLTSGVEVAFIPPLGGG
jgi:molybdopterin converting factor small subunit